MSDTKCRLSTCDWSGSVDEIFTHVETYHRNIFRSHNGKNYYDFTLDDLPREAYLLSGPEGLYWFCLNPHEDQKAENGDDMLSRGVFHIGDSEPVQYTLKIGQVRDAHAEYLGVFTSQEENLHGVEKYELEFPFSFIEFLNTVAPSRKMRLYFGDYDDSDDFYWPDPDEVYWSEEDLELNRMVVEMLTCAICFEFIRDNARFCENKHFLCLDCFNKMHEKRLRKCPTCRGDYLVDCFDERINHFLKMVKFPSEDEPEPPKRITLCERFTQLQEEKEKAVSAEAGPPSSQTEAPALEAAPSAQKTEVAATEEEQTNQMVLSKRFELHHLEKSKAGFASAGVVSATKPGSSSHQIEVGKTIMTLSERFKLQALEKSETESSESKQTEVAATEPASVSQKPEDVLTGQMTAFEQLKQQHPESTSKSVSTKAAAMKRRTASHQTDDAATEPGPSKHYKAA